MIILVTGATGFIGRCLTERLLKENHQVFALVRKTSNAGWLLDNGVKLIYGDITDWESLQSCLNYNIDVVFHCAALVKSSDMRKLYPANVLGTENICKLCLMLKVERLIYVSTVAVVIGNKEVPLKEDMPYLANAMYGVSKIEAEKKVIEYRNKGLRAAIIRPPIVYGEGEPHAMSKLMFLLKHRLVFLPQRVGKLHLGYVGNVVEGLMLALRNDEFLKGSYFVADDEVLTVKEIFSTFAGAIGVPAPYCLPEWMTHLLIKLPKIGRRFKSLTQDKVFDLSRSKSAGFVPKYSAKESLYRSARSFLKLGTVLD